MAAKFDPKAKAKKQKIVAAVLGVVLLGVLAWQVPSLMKTLNKKPPPSGAPAPAPAPAPVPGATGAVVPPATGTPVATSVSTGTLVDSDPAAQPAGGQLLTFDRFASKDPFAQQLGTPAASAAAAAGKAAWKPAPAPIPPPPRAAKTPAAKTPAAVTSARISVNGAPEQVGVGVSFPKADPLFVLVTLTPTTAKVGISEGTLDTGSPTVTLKKGKKLTLQNTVDGARYELLLVSTS
jgi:hypothetical protein